MFRYNVGIIDHFYGCTPIVKYIQDNAEDGYAIQHAIETLAAGVHNLSDWEGDGFIGIFGVPEEVTCQIGLVIKQSNNGTTFVISPVELPHLQQYLIPR